MTIKWCYYECAARDAWTTKTEILESLRPEAAHFMPVLVSYMAPPVARWVLLQADKPLYNGMARPTHKDNHLNSVTEHWSSVSWNELKGLIKQIRATAVYDSQQKWFPSIIMLFSTIPFHLKLISVGVEYSSIEKYDIEWIGRIR